MQPHRAAAAKRSERVVRIEFAGELDAHAAEAFTLEVRRLVRRYADVVTNVRVEASGVKPRGVSA